MNLTLDFDHPYFSPVDGFIDILVQAHRSLAGQNSGLIAVVAEEETLADVTENINLAKRLGAVDGVTGVLMAPQELELSNGRVSWQGQPVSLIFMDFNTDVLLALHRKHDLTPVLQAVKEHRVINPRGTEPFNVKSMFADFRCLMGPRGMLGFVGRYGGIPTNVGSGGGFQPLAILASDMGIRQAVNNINDTISSLDAGDLIQVVEEQNQMAMNCDFTYLLGPVKIALRPRVITAAQVEALKSYGQKMWADCLTLENLWLTGQLDDLIRIEEEELEIARMNPWHGSAAIIASDGLFGFGAEPN
jgi:hypothetical protein